MTQFNTINCDVSPACLQQAGFLTFNNIGQDVSPDRTKLSHYLQIAFLDMPCEFEYIESTE